MRNNRALACVVLALMALMIWLVKSHRFAGQGSATEQPLKEQWTFALDSHISAPLALADDGTVIAATEGGWLYAIKPGGHLAWKFRIGPTVAAPIVGEDGTVYIETKEQQVYAINPDGTAKWTAAGGGYANKNSPWHAGALDSVFFYTPWRGAVRAFSLTSGKIEWDADDGFENDGAVAIAPNNAVLYPGTGRINAVDFLGKNTWRYPAVGTPYFEAVLDNHGRPPDGGLWLDSPMAVNSDGTIYAGAELERFIALNPDGTLKWQYIARGSGRTEQSPVIGNDGAIYFACADGTLYAMNSDGTKKWAAQIGSHPSAAPMLADDGAIFLATEYGLIQVSPEGRIQKRTYLNSVAVSSMMLGPDGTLYLAYRAGVVKAFSMSHGGLMKSPWPKFQHDLRNTGHAGA